MLFVVIPFFFSALVYSVMYVVTSCNSAQIKNNLNPTQILILHQY